MEAVKQDGLALEYVETRTLELCAAAIRQDLEAFRFVKEE